MTDIAQYEPLQLGKDIRILHKLYQSIEEVDHEITRKHQGLFTIHNTLSDLMLQIENIKGYIETQVCEICNNKFNFTNTYHKKFWCDDCRLDMESTPLSNRTCVECGVTFNARWGTHHLCSSCYIKDTKNE